MHRLTLADIVNVPQRPKVEEHESYLFVLTVMASITSAMKLGVEQMGLILGDGYLLTFQHDYGDVFDPVRERIRDGRGPIRRSGSDYLAYALLDAVVDGYFPVLEQIGEELEELENEVVNNPDESILKRIYQAKREMLGLRRAVWPQRESISSLTRDEHPFISKTVRVYFRDTYDHVAQVIDIIETYRELAGSFMDIYLSSLSNRMNEVMKVLTLFATVFMPLSFLAGIYGMNFEYMPELKLRWAYPMFWIFILSIAIAMLTFFVKRGWIDLSSSGGKQEDLNE
jgi:magnesium transporter